MAVSKPRTKAHRRSMMTYKVSDWEYAVNMLFRLALLVLFGYGILASVAAGKIYGDFWLSVAGLLVIGLATIQLYGLRPHTVDVTGDRLVFRARLRQVTIPIGELRAIRLCLTGDDSRERETVEFEHLGGTIETPMLSEIDQLISVLTTLHPAVKVKGW